MNTTAKAKTVFVPEIGSPEPSTASLLHQFRENTNSVYEAKIENLQQTVHELIEGAKLMANGNILQDLGEVELRLNLTGILLTERAMICEDQIVEDQAEQELSMEILKARQNAYNKALEAVLEIQESKLQAETAAELLDHIDAHGDNEKTEGPIITQLLGIIKEFRKWQNALEQEEDDTEPQAYDPVAEMHCDEEGNLLPASVIEDR